LLVSFAAGFFLLRAGKIPLVLALDDAATFPGIVLTCRIIGILQIEQWRSAACALARIKRRCPWPSA
jgi:hypothetical protein